ncbi:NAD(P)/FAD-dependent oxidoreductase [Nocardia cerradoensis]|uniref:NAD(P)/FAD-dependent oxidoreductase n=1 Tax=Nocardia cerradoensis TaxID=85688 RepID=UPI000317643A|nr:FAD-dependent oxidoreductase [Nocardia cerradoensis]NKY46655.1 FAD-dependent oxidoreductase [Nocardia cerradoensis]
MSAHQIASHRILVLGAGYAGLAAAGRLCKSRGAQITVVDSRAEMVERVRLHQLAAGQTIERRDLRTMLERKGAHFVRGRVAAIDTAAQEVSLSDGSVLGYDTLVYTLGSAADVDSVAGVREYAHPVATLENIAALPPLRGRVAVVGAGATGIETAAELAESHPELPVALVSSERPGFWLSDRAQRHIAATLERLGVEVHAGAKVVEAAADGVRLAGGGRIEAETVLWTTGFTTSDLAARAGLAVDARGRVLVDATLRTSDPHVYAAGDCAAIAGPGGRELRMACATALPTGSHAARAALARMRGAEPDELRFRYLLQCISLGRRDAVVQFVRADDAPTPRALTGRPAAVVKEMIVRGAAMQARP